MEPCIVSNIDRVPEDVVARLGAHGAATVHEALRQRGLMTPSIRPTHTGMRVAGPAVTSLNHAGDNLMLHAALQVTQPGDVLVVATMSHNTDGMFGELLATQCRARGIAAVVLDAGVRDTREIAALGLPVWARAVSAAGTVKAAPGWVNVPVVCGGVIVEPGDAVVADDDGIVVVPREIALAVADAADARVTKEAGSRARYEAGELSLDVNQLRTILEKLGVRTIDSLRDRHE